MPALKALPQARSEYTEENAPYRGTSAMIQTKAIRPSSVYDDREKVVDFQGSVV